MRKKQLIIMFTVFMALVNLFVANSVFAENQLDNNSIRTPVSSKNKLNDIVYGNGIFVAVGDNGDIVVSKDKLNWLHVDSEIKEDLNSVIWSNEQFIAVGDNGIILVSEHGEIWNNLMTDDDYNFNDIVFESDMYVIVGESSDTYLQSGIIYTSKDGATWTRVQSDIEYKLTAIAYNGERFVAVGIDDSSLPTGGIYSSEDGVNWAKRLDKDDESTTFFDVTWGDDQFVAVGGNVFNSKRIFTSPDGINWTSRDQVGFYPIYHISYINGKYIGVGILGSVTVSEDAVSWNQVQLEDIDLLCSVAYDGDKYIIVGDKGRILSGKDFTDVDYIYLAGDRDILIKINGKILDFPIEYGKPYIDESDRTQIPLRAVAEALGYKVEWEQKTGTVTIDDSIKLKIGSNIVRTPKENIQMDTKAYIVKDRTYVPLRFVVEALGYDVDYKNLNNKHLIEINYSEEYFKEKYILDISEIRGEVLKIVDNFIYFINEKHEIARVDIVSGEMIIIQGHELGILVYFEVVDDYIYYARALSDDRALYRVKIGSGKKEKVFSQYFARTTFIEDWIYFINQKDNGNIYKMKLDGSQLTKLTSDINGLTHYTIAQDNIYYKLNTGIYKVNTDGTKKEKVIDYVDNPKEEWAPVYEVEPGEEIKIIDNYIYYTYRKSLYKFNTKNKENTKVIDDIEDRYAIKDNLIYYRDDYGRFFKLNTDTNEAIQLIEDGPIREILFLKGSYVYYRSIKYSEIYRINIHNDKIEKIVGRDGVTFVKFDDKHIFYNNGTEKNIKVLKVNNDGSIDSIID